MIIDAFAEPPFDPQVELPPLDGGTHEELAASIIEDRDGDARAAVLALVKIIHLLMLDKDGLLQATSPGRA